MSERMKTIGNPSNDICPYCGETVREHLIHDAHIIPTALYKWVSVPPELMREMSKADVNVLRAHTHCDTNAGSTIPGHKDIDWLFINNVSGKQELYQLHTDLQPYILQFMSLKNDVLAKQKGCCYKCHCELKAEQGILRRKDWNQPRALNNAKILCTKCNDSLSRTKRGTGSKYVNAEGVTESLVNDPTRRFICQILGLD